MESWQKDYIRKNLPALLNYTSCSSTFLARLYTNGVVSNEEVDILQNISNSQEQTAKLYAILQTRTDNYNLLKICLQDTAQSGALAILDKCIDPNSQQNEIGETSASSAIQMTTWEDTNEYKLHQAIQNGDLQAINNLVRIGADVNALNSRNETPIIIAALNKVDGYVTVKILKYLIEHGADVFDRDRKANNTFLHILALRESPLNPSQFQDMVAFLISKGLARLFNTSGGDDNSTPFQEAVKRMEIQTGTLSELKRTGVRFNAVNKEGYSVLYYATWGNRTLKLISDLVDLGANPNHLDNRKTSVLHIAAGSGNVELVKFFLERGLDIDAQNSEGNTPLHYAIFGGPILSRRYNF